MEEKRKSPVDSGSFAEELEAMPAAEQENALWNMLETMQGTDFYTAKGLEFSYAIRGGEMFVSRKEKSITQATVFAAYRQLRRLGEGKLPAAVSGPKKLGTFGASYLYPVFRKIGLIA